MRQGVSKERLQALAEQGYMLEMLSTEKRGFCRGEFCREEL
jgi:hypothetical protein